MKFKRGITGFCGIADEQTIPQIEEKELKTYAYRVDSSTEFRLRKLIKPDASSNYYRLHYQNTITHESIDVVVNHQYPYYVGLTSDSSWMQLKFAELPSGIRSIFDPTFEYLTPEFLNSAFANEDLSELSGSEIQQITYWKSRTYGEVIFNGYD